MLSSWIMQIVLSELLGVPTTMETSMPDDEASFNFYDPSMRFSYSKGSYDYDALRASLEHGDCVSFQANNAKSGGEYKSCAHVMPEAWNGQKENMASAEEEGLIEPTTGSGGVAKYSWYVPHFTAERDPIILSYFGMTSGDDDLANRRRLPELFLRPQTWKWFCDNVSADNCSTPYYDEEGRLIASRPPADEGEEVRYFSAGSFHGHFAPTEENDCDANPFTCTGHIANVQCDWSTFAIPQAHYLGIPVKGSGPGVAGGYPYGRMVDIYNAANYTKSNVLFYWFTPDALMQEYLDTDAEFQRVLLPPSTEECTESRVTIDQRCSENPEDRIGDPAGACDAEAHSYQKLIVSNMYERTYAQPEPSRSPAYDAIKAMKFSDLQLEYMFRRWYERNTDRWNYDPREAVCQWAAENIETLKRFVPRSFPRTRNIEQYNTPGLYSAMVVAGITIVLVCLVGVAVWQWRKKKVFVYVQPTFLFMLLCGFLMVCVGAILNASTPSKGTCVASQWFIVLGYSLELIPLIVKVAAINKIFQSAKKMKRVKIEPKKLYTIVGVFLAAVAIYLIAWTVVDPYTRQTTKSLSDETNESGGQVVEITYSCASQSSVWLIIVYIYIFLLLIAATVLAFQSRNVKQEFRESGKLAMLVYTHFLFILLRAIIWIFGSSIDANVASTISSYLLSVDTLVSLGLYFVPKLLDARKAQSDYVSGNSRLSSYSNNESTGSENLGTVAKIRANANRRASNESHYSANRRASNESHYTNASVGSAAGGMRSMPPQASYATHTSVASYVEAGTADAETPAANAPIIQSRRVSWDGECKAPATEQIISSKSEVEDIAANEEEQ